ncbi:uncharacterized protein C1orf189 homolog isoform X1 [Scleropages formosus]|uniref:uncharacterized protein C1orf189 homolog isoform X1 n=1 Tax=Scleropages formosus TaxID=113540 RepID=UPI0008785BC7|nr:uncharacterized protein C1orf189 homolog isoform X1 [Scleropages formosus]
MSASANARQFGSTFVQEESYEKKEEEELLGRKDEGSSIRTAKQKGELKSLSQVVSASVLRHTQRVLKREAALWHRALVMERRAALLDLLEQDRQQYTMELNQMGKAFYMLRI